MKGVVARLTTLLIGSLSLYFLVLSSSHAANSVFELATRAIVIVTLIIYGFGGNSALSKASFMKVFSTPMTKEHFKNLGNSTGQGKA